MTFSKILTIFVVLTMFVGVAHAGEQPDLNGTFWKKMSQSQRDLFVMGMFEGRNFGHWDVRLALMQEAKDYPPKGVESKLMESWATDFSAKDYLSKKATNVTAAQVVSGITKMYADYRNQQIPIVSLVDVVTESIKGASNNEIEKRLLELRQEVAKGNAQQ